MSIKLSDKEINQRLVRLRNLEWLHKQARKKIIAQDKEIKFLKARVKELEEKNQEKDKSIEEFRLQLEEIKIKVFGKKKDKGGEITSILASVLLSLKWMNPNNFIKKYLSLSY